MKANLILYNIGTLVTGKELSLTSNSMENIEVLENAYLAISNGEVLEYGIGEIPKNLIADNTLLEDIHGKVVTPGIIDSHTHLVHYGSRENELPLKIKGVPYLEILRNDGGILSTVRATRKATKEELFQKAKATLDRMLRVKVDMD